MASEAPAGSRPVGGLARAIGVLGGLLSAALCVLVLVAFVELVIYARTEPAGLGPRLAHGLGSIGLGLALVTGAVVSLLMIPLLGISIHAVVDALREARGGSAGRLWLFYAVFGGLAVAAGWDSDEGESIATLVAVLAAVVGTNLVAWIVFIRAHRATRRAEARG